MNLDVSWTLIDARFHENELSLDSILIGDYFVYKSLRVSQEEGCKLSCHFERACSFFFMLQPGMTRWRHHRNCYFGSFSKDRRSPQSYDYYSDYNDYYSRKRHEKVTPPRPNKYGFKPSTLLHLTTKTKATNFNFTEVLITKLGLIPPNDPNSSYYGYCQGSGIHIISRKQPWTLPFQLVYLNNQGCTFKILKMVTGNLKLSVPNFTVRLYVT